MAIAGAWNKRPEQLLQKRPKRERQSKLSVLLLLAGAASLLLARHRWEG